MVPVPIADEIKMRSKTCVVEHPPRISANGKSLALVDQMVLVEDKSVWIMRDGAAVDDRLSVIFARRLKLRELKQAVGP